MHSNKENKIRSKIVNDIAGNVNDYSSDNPNLVMKSMHNYKHQKGDVAHYIFPSGGDDITSLLLRNTDTAITELYQSKTNVRKKLLPKLLKYFKNITILIFIFLFLPFPNIYSTSLKSALIYGFFANFLVLLIIVFKYAFSSSKEYYKFATTLLYLNNHKDIDINKSFKPKRKKEYNTTSKNSALKKIWCYIKNI